VPGADLLCHRHFLQCPVTDTVNRVPEPQHLGALWQRRREARAGSGPSLPRDCTRLACEFIHCQCAICAGFRTSAGVWQTVPCTLQVGCKCARCRQCFDVSGHWYFQRAHQRGLEGRRQDLEPATHKSLLQLVMQQDTAVPHVATQCQLSWQQVQSERHRVRQALDRRQQTHGHKHVVSLSQTATTSTAQFVTGVRRRGHRHHLH